MAVNHRNEMLFQSASHRLRSIYKHNHSSSEFCVTTAKLHALYCVMLVSLLCLCVRVLLTLPSVKQIYLRKVLLIMPVTTKRPHAVSSLSCLCCV